MAPDEALKNIRTLIGGSALLKDDDHRKLVLRSVLVLAQKGLGIAPDGKAELAENVLPFPDPQRGN